MIVAQLSHKPVEKILYFSTKQLISLTGHTKEYMITLISKNSFCVELKGCKSPQINGS